MSTTKFFSGDKTYIEEAAEYLDSRGLTIQDLAVDTYKTYNMGFHTKGPEGYEPFIPAGWAFRIRNPEGEYYDDRWLLRVCNWPDKDLFQKSGDKWVALAGKPPKFIQVSTKGADCTHYVSTMNEMCNAPIVMFHEKYTSAALTKKLLNVPSIALSGCTNWSYDGKLKDTLQDMIRLMRTGTKIIVCFDGDIVENVNVMNAASQLKGWITNLRDDLEVVFPMVPPLPEGMNGWDDYTVHQGDNAQAAWLEMLEADGVDVSSALPIKFMIEKYQVKVRQLKEKVAVEHTPENYRRLLKHPKWRPYTMDSGGVCYQKMDDGSVQAVSFDDLVRRFQAWLADVPFQGDGANVGALKARDALREEMMQRTVSVPVMLLQQQPEVSYEEAYAAAYKLVTEGLKVNGPMTTEEAAITMMRCARDMVALWSDDRKVDVQWVIALVGPSGCGKSNFPKSFTQFMDDMGVRGVHAQLAKEGSRASIEELYRQTRDTLVAVFDEYNPAEVSARQVEQNLFTLSSTRTFAQRRLHEEDAREAMRRSSLFLTTVDKNRTFMRTGKGAGGERRFIVMEVEGVVMYGGKMTSNRAVVAQCGRVLLRYGLQMLQAGDNEMANEFSIDKNEQYISKVPILGRIGLMWAKADLQQVLDKFFEAQYRKKTEDYRFTAPQLQELLLPGEKLQRMDTADFINEMMELGVEDIGKAFVNTPSGEKQKDKAFRIVDKDVWCLALHAKL